MVSITFAKTTGLQLALDAKASLAGATFTGNVSAYNLTANGGVYTPILSVNGDFFTVAASGDLNTNGYINSLGNMTAPDVILAGTSLITRLASKQDTITDGSLTIARTTGLQALLDAKAALAGATFTGNVSAYNLTATGGVYTPILNVNGLFLQ